MDPLDVFMLVAGALVFASVVAGLHSVRSRLSFLLIVLVVGMLAGEDGPGGIVFDNVLLAPWVASAALGVALALMLVARPLAVAVFPVPLRFTRGEVGFFSWVGLRGAVPVVPAMSPLVAGVPHARERFEIAFVCVLAWLVLQGATLVRAVRFFGGDRPDAADEPAARRVLGDFVLDGGAPVRELCAFDGLAPPEHEGTLAQWPEAKLRRPPVVGDGVDWQGAHFSVRQRHGARVVRVGRSLGAAE